MNEYCDTCRMRDRCGWKHLTDERGAERCERLIKEAIEMDRKDYYRAWFDYLREFDESD